MKAFSISYDLNKSGKDYKGLISAIMGLGANLHCTDSYWLVACNQTSQQIYDKLKPYLDNDDHIFITRIGGERQGWLPRAKWDWIDQHVSRTVTV